MKNIFLFLLSCIGGWWWDCRATSAIDTISNDETLIASNYKVIEHGYFTFPVFINENEVKELVYYYSINIKEKNVWCSKNSERIYSISEKTDIPRILTYKRQKNLNALKLIHGERNIMPVLPMIF
jgi:hypothetical protein